MKYFINNYPSKSLGSLRLIFLFLLVSSTFFACSDGSDDPGKNGTEITKFSFLRADNPNLKEDISIAIEGDKLLGRIPLSSNLNSLVAYFEHTGMEVLLNNVEQTSGETSNNFTETLIYTVRSKSGSSKQYQTEIVRFTGLPAVFLKTDGNLPIDSKEDYREGDLSLDGNLLFSDLPTTEMEIRGRGNSTWGVHPKKPYQLKFSDKIGLLGMPKDKKWIFLAEHSDKSLMRNKITFEMGYLSDLDWTPESVFAEVFLNNKYAGTYNISQKVEEGSNRLDLGDNGYLLEIDQLERLDPEDVYFRTDDFLINIKEPELEYDSDEYIYAKNLLNEFETVLNGNNFKDPVNGYAKYIDLPSFVDWYLISEIVKNQDSKDFSSIFLHVIPGEKIKMGPLWDFDLAFGNVNYSPAQFPEGFWVKDHAWYARLFQDPEFVKLIKERFTFFRNNQNYILDKMDYYAHQLRWAQYENDEEWDVLGNYIWPNPVVFNTYQEEVDHLKTWYTQRMDWLNDAFNEL